VEKPAILFKDDWRERVNIYVTDYLKKEGLTLQTLDKEQKQELVHALYRVGAFESKNAANYIADVLQISRATLYNYLKTK
jgi:predicted transcriptional regulator YheO